MRMRRTRAALTIVAFAAVLGSPLAALNASAQSAVSLWVEFSASEPGAGCTVDVSVDGGGSLAGADVSLVVSDDATGAVISSDASSANESGIAWLGIDTSAAPSGTKAWASVSVNGGYIGGNTIWVTDGGCSDGASLVEMSGTAPSAATGNTETRTESSGGAVIIPGAFGYQQDRGLSCEYASLAIATGMLGDWVSEYDFDAVVPLNANPHWGYRGNINGSWGNTTDYGVYNAPLASALNAYGFQGEAFYGGPSDLMAQLDMGRPTLVWIGARGESGSFSEYTADGTRYQLTPYMHVVVIYGYDDGGVYVSDPGNGSLTYWDWGSFKAMWAVMDGMALAVHW